VGSRVRRDAARPTPAAIPSPSLPSAQPPRAAAVGRVPPRGACFSSLLWPQAPTVKKRRLTLCPEARQELEQAVEWYEVRLPDLGRQFRAEVYRALDNVIARPALYAKFRGATRKPVLGRFACLIFYLVETGWIIVFAVFQAKRDPFDVATRS